MCVSQVRGTEHQPEESLEFWLHIQYLCAYAIQAPNELNLMLISVNYEFRNVFIDNEWHSGRVEHEANVGSGGVHDNCSIPSFVESGPRMNCENNCQLPMAMAKWFTLIAANECRV